MNILVPNLGSTSLKYQILAMPGERSLSKGRFERVKDYREAIAQIDTSATPVDGVAFKAVHAGPDYRGTFLIDDGVVRAMEEYLLAVPVHNAIYLAAIQAFREAMPGVPWWALSRPSFTRRCRITPGSMEFRWSGAQRNHEVRVSRSFPPVRGRNGFRPVGAAEGLTPPGQLSPGGSSSMCAVDRAVRWTPLWASPRSPALKTHAPRRPGCLCGPLHDGTPWVEPGGSAPTTGTGGRFGGVVRGARGRRARPGGIRPGRQRQRYPRLECLQLPGQEDDWAYAAAMEA